MFFSDHSVNNSNVNKKSNSSHEDPSTDTITSSTLVLRNHPEHHLLCAPEHRAKSATTHQLLLNSEALRAQM